MAIDKLSANAFATGAIANSLGYTPLSATAPSAVANSTANVISFAANGNVGISTNSPTMRLDVRNTSADYQMHLGDSASAVLGYELGRENTGGLFKFYGNQTGATGYIFSGADGERMRIAANGNVGINIASPQTLLHIQGAGTTSPSNTSNLAAGGSIFLYNAGTGSSTNGTIGIFGHVAGDLGIASGIGFSRENLNDWGTQIRFYTHPTATSNIKDVTESMRITAAGLLQFNSGFGSVATAYGVRAWVNFDSATTGSPVIQSSGNISSIGDRGAGQFTINFSNAFPDANYALCGSVESQTGWQGITQYTDAGGGSPATASNKSTTQCMIVTTYGTPSDFAEVSVLFVR